MINSNRVNGYIILMATLILGAISGAVALSLLTRGIDGQQISIVHQRSTQVLAAANACAEEALQVLHDNTSFIGADNQTVGGITCDYTVTSAGGNDRTIVSTATKNGVARTITTYVTINVSSLSITGWQEVN